MNEKFKGIYAVAVTPFKENGEFDLEQSKKNLDWLIENGVHGVCILGATGEYQSISDEEHMNYCSLYQWPCKRHCWGFQRKA